MELDFSKIDSLVSPQKPASEPKEKNHSKTLKTTKKPAEGKIEPQAQALQRKADDRFSNFLKYRVFRCLFIKFSPFVAFLHYMTVPKIKHMFPK